MVRQIFYCCTKGEKNLVWYRCGSVGAVAGWHGRSDVEVAGDSPLWYLALMETVNNVVKRANETIGIVPTGSHRLTHLVRRLYSVLLLFSQRQGDQEEYRALLSDMLDAANSSGSNRAQVKQILRDIRAIGVDWNVRDGDREIWKNVGLIEEPGLIDGKGTPTVVTWKLPKIIRSRLLDPHGFFTRISLETMTRLKSGASIALYEICCQYASNDHGKGEGGLTAKASLEEWMPRILGMRKTGYEYKFFKRDVLQPAIAEIAAIAGMRVELIEHKVGRKVAALQFRVFPQATLGGPMTAATTAPPAPAVRGRRATVAVPSPTPAASAPMAPHAERIVALGLTRTAAEAICREYAAREAYLLQSIAFVEARANELHGAPLRSKAAFFRQALKEGYATTAAVSPVARKARPLVSVQPTESPEEIEARQAVLARKDETWRRYQAMTNEGMKKALLDEFLLGANAAVVTFARKGGINNMVVKTSFIDWLMTVKQF